MNLTGYTQRLAKIAGRIYNKMLNIIITDIGIMVSCKKVWEARREAIVR